MKGLLLALLCAIGPQQPELPADLAELAARFRAYRVELRENEHHERPELRYWDGEVHRTWTEVGHRLGAGRYTERQVVAMLGEPDETFTAGGRHGTVLVPKGERHLIYWWRGGHDYLYFVVRRGRVVEERWWFAGE